MIAVVHTSSRPLESAFKAWMSRNRGDLSKDPRGVVIHHDVLNSSGSPGFINTRGTAQLDEFTEFWPVVALRCYC